MIRYKFCTRETEDCRPLKPCKWFVSGYADWYWVIVCYLPKNENLLDYWDDAFSIFMKEVDDNECDTVPILR